MKTTTRTRVYRRGLRHAGSHGDADDAHLRRFTEVLRRRPGVAESTTPKMLRAMKLLEVDLMADLAYNLFATRRLAPTPAQNINTVGEVPDSSWFTNRLGHRAADARGCGQGP